MREKLWLCQDGRAIRVGEMDEQHLKNAVAKIERGELPGREHWLPRMYMDLAARTMPVRSQQALRIDQLDKIVGMVLARLITRGLVRPPESEAQEPGSESKGSKTAKSRSVRRGAGSSSTRKRTRRSGTK